MKIVTYFSREELNRMGYPVVVEMWERVLHTGRGKRAFNETFDEHERAVIRRYYPIFRRWYLQTGTPSERRMSMTTYHILVRAIQFFASF